MVSGVADIWNLRLSRVSQQEGDREYYIMFPRMSKVLRLVLFTCVSMLYVVLLLQYQQKGHNNNNNNNNNNQQVTQKVDPSKSLFLQQKSVMSSRVAHVKEKCTSDPLPKLKLQTQVHTAAQVSSQLARHYHNIYLKKLYEHVLFFPQGNFSWCLVPKVASSSMSEALINMEGLKQPEDKRILQSILRKTRSKGPERENQTMGAPVKFLFVRHPFRRIVSAYRDKLEDSYKHEDGLYFYKTFGRNIVQKFGWRGRPLKNDVAKGRKNDVGKGEIIALEALATAEEEKREPKFTEFVDYLINTSLDDFDEHWKPITLLCQVCSISYDYILKYENFKEEVDFLVESLQKERRFPMDFKIGWQNRQGTNDGMAAKYLSLIEEDKLQQLYKKYYHDFVYFDYKMDEYN
ncbi:hypothetical protein Pmani_001843 [Petrolisthes manimaculis]|uniref:Carbohydrate sulfotransferase n=1 Tax=Petrolisthes manimaculis TaxID=1843537 RepID=A0AAE1UL09_9EUCA|nr:hypothetical protein Pmani_001843 [Petrolisthes manimaculis]